MPKTTVKIIPDADKNTITYSKNFRIFSVIAPINRVESVDFVSEDIDLSSPADASNVIRKFRYSRNKNDWSLWYDFSPSDISNLQAIPFDPEDPTYIQVKYQYDDGTNDALASALLINEIKIRFNTKRKGSSFSMAPKLTCSGEKCPPLIFDKDPTFNPYEVDGAISINKELSFGVNQMFGHQVVYFKTDEDSDSGDYIFKEWSIRKNTERKCIKVLVDQNNFPDNKPNYDYYGIDFEHPFEVHIDHAYYQSIFGKGEEPHDFDVIYFPLIDRMFEIQGAYLYRGIMMEPLYWKIQLDKYEPNASVIMSDDNRKFIDNIILDTEEAFGEEIEDEVKDATMPQQYSTISKKFDPTRSGIHPAVSLKSLKYSFNFATMIDTYYDFSNIDSTVQKYKILNESPAISTTQELVQVENENDKREYDVVRAYQDSPLFKTWLNGAIVSGDINPSTNSSRNIRVRGPFDTIPDHVGQSETGRYLQIEAYRDLTFTKQRNVNINANDELPIKIRSLAVVYNEQAKFNATDLCNLSFTSFFNIPEGSTRIEFLRAYDYEKQQGLHIYATFSKYLGSTEEGDLTIYINLNDEQYIHTVPMFKCGYWQAIVISLSNEFKQQGVFLYSIKKDPSAQDNYEAFVQLYENTREMEVAEFNIDQKYHIISSNAQLANIRLFNTMIKPEQHEFILSQQFIKDESMLLIIDNCRKPVDVPYISRNK